MNVLNIDGIERELRRCACYARHPSARQWVLTVARNHILSAISLKDRDVNFIAYTGLRHPAHIEMPRPHQLPKWAHDAIGRGEVLYWFDTVQVRRRNLWQAVEQIVHYFNNWPVGDRRFLRLDLVAFQTAASAAAMWFSDVQTNLWDYVKDAPPVIYKFIDGSGFHWVKMVTPLHFERESRMMNHCVGNGQYYNCYKSGINEYYSLRDRNNMPHATMEVSINQRETGHNLGCPPPDRSVRNPAMSQCKGKANGKPDEKYQRYIYSFLLAQRWPISGDSGQVDRTAIVAGEFHKRA